MQGSPDPCTYLHLSPLWHFLHCSHFQHGLFWKCPALRILRTRSFGTYKAVEGTMGLLWDIVTVNKCKIPKANNCRQKTQKCVLFIIAFLLLCFYISDEDSHYFPTKTKTLLTSVHSGLYASSSSLHSFPCFSLFHDNTLCFPASTYPTKTPNIFFVKLVSSHSSIHKL
jgi:hypothetical protein